MRWQFAFLFFLASPPIFYMFFFFILYWCSNMAEHGMADRQLDRQFQRQNIITMQQAQQHQQWWWWWWQLVIRWSYISVAVCVYEIPPGALECNKFLLLSHLLHFPVRLCLCCSFYYVLFTHTHTPLACMSVCWSSCGVFYNVHFTFNRRSIDDDNDDDHHHDHHYHHHRLMILHSQQQREREREASEDISLVVVCCGGSS